MTATAAQPSQSKRPEKWQRLTHRRDRRFDATFSQEGGEGRVDVVDMIDGEIEAEHCSLRSGNDSHNWSR